MLSASRRWCVFTYQVRVTRQAPSAGMWCAFASSIPSRRTRFVMAAYTRGRWRLFSDRGGVRYGRAISQRPDSTLSRSPSAGGNVSEAGG